MVQLHQDAAVLLVGWMTARQDWRQLAFGPAALYNDAEEDTGTHAVHNCAFQNLMTATSKQICTAQKGSINNLFHSKKLESQARERESSPSGT